MVDVCYSGYHTPVLRIFIFYWFVIARNWRFHFDLLQIEFLHETLANLMFAQDVISNVLKTFPKHEAHVSLKPTMCLIQQMNRKMQCRKIRKKKRWTNFENSGACKVKNSVPKLSVINPSQTLLEAKSALGILLKTQTFWKKCIVEKKGKLRVKGKCRKSKRKPVCKKRNCKKTKIRKCRNCKKTKKGKRQRKN